MVSGLIILAVVAACAIPVAMRLAIRYPALEALFGRGRGVDVEILKKACTMILATKHDADTQECRW